MTRKQEQKGRGLFTGFCGFVSPHAIHCTLSRWRKGGVGSRTSPSLPSLHPAPGSHLTCTQVAGLHEGLCAHGGRCLELGALSRQFLRLSLKPGAPSPHAGSWQIKKPTNTDSRCAGKRAGRVTLGAP